MFVYYEVDGEYEEKKIYQSKDLACLLHFTMFGEDLNRAPKKRKIDMNDIPDDYEIKVKKTMN